MASNNVFSRLLPGQSHSASVYETMRRQEEEDRLSDVEDGDLAIDEENLGERFQAQDLEALLHEDTKDTTSAESSPELRHHDSPAPRRSSTRGADNKPPLDNVGFGRRPNRAVSRDDDDDEVPESLLLEGFNEHETGTRGRRRGQREQFADQTLPPPVTAPTNPTTKSQWRATQAQQRLHHPPSHAAQPPQRTQGMMITDPREKAMWKWSQVVNLDQFLERVYDYFCSHGMYSIILRQLLNLATGAFAFGFSTYLFMCIDYSKLAGSRSLDDVYVKHCVRRMPFLAHLTMWLFTAVWVYKLIQLIIGIPSLLEMHNFYHYLLDIPDRDIQTVSWQLVVERLMRLRDANPTTADNLTPHNRRYILRTQSKQRMDAHDIANRLMRRENYMIALFNKDILDLAVDIPFMGKYHIFTRTIQWNISLAILDFAFDPRGQIQPMFLSDRSRRDLIKALNTRFLVFGVLSIVSAPFLVFYNLVIFFFRNFTEYQRNPAELGSRIFSPIAEWKFREFNELGHLFERRKNLAYPYAVQYLNQFPKDRMAQLSRFITFVSGALFAVLFLATLFDSELFLGFELTTGRTALFYMGILGTIWGTARSGIPDEDIVLDPEYALTHVIYHTRYYPPSWHDKLHSDEVRKDFSTLYKLRIILFLEEAMSIIFAPYAMLYSLPKSSERIVDFFRESTIHVDGLGHVCSFAIFDFKKGSYQMGKGKDNPTDIDPIEFRDNYLATKDNKVMASYYGFMDNYGANQNRGHPVRTSRRHFVPPPVFPGMASSIMGGDGIRHRQSHHRTPRLGPTASHSGHPGSPLNSLLLDPHHQPHLRHSPRQSSTPTRHRLANQVPLERPDENEEQGLEERLAEHDMQRTASNDVDLGADLDSWQKDADSTDDETPSGVNQAGDGNTGVLGLLYQFQKAQTDGRGGNL
ncbi:APG9-domain-containing protein [Eremomyces bilateralis CBS 781.70]|uniref:Autophagy-related protein 9 n=1 Tax=Eremomyces bilateralis CBS 781.70 TaxID=1392243 RepID=A0A6G1FTJ7_9PEZI|nr:APG9-domain-containing protein [Eremomyces bilateralis CBS 781.70]KAF1808999.1 APG9-domain-containing protein [Eremomyces bilateralis CBS 781.70]